MRFAVFSKHLQEWPLEACVSQVAAAGFEGLDLTVRPGGYVEPSRVAEELPRAVKLARSAGLEVPLITTGILSTDDPTAELVLRVAGELGIGEAKLGYWPLPDKGVRGAISDAKRELAKLAKSAEKAGIRIDLHNHSGTCVSHSAWVVAELLADHPPERVGAYFDPAHFTVEGAEAGWRAALDLLAGRVALLAVKDFRWSDPSSDGGAGKPQERLWLPVGRGNVRWAEVFRGLRVGGAGGFDGWASIHGEYQGPRSWKELRSPEVLAQAARDRDFVRGVADGLRESA